MDVAVLATKTTWLHISEGHNFYITAVKTGSLKQASK
jgi:hypothetical protein